LLRDKAPSIAAPVFAAFLVIIISISTTLLIQFVVPKKLKDVAVVEAAYKKSPQSAPNAEGSRSSQQPGTVHNDDVRASSKPKDKELPQKSLLSKIADIHGQIIRITPWEDVAVLIIVFTLIGFVASRYINVNIFSMHGMYRDRLIRAYLGASRGNARKPNPFTGFDGKDNIPMRCLWPQPTDPSMVQNATAEFRPLFQVINTALNLVHGRNLAWQERKAESFTITPLHCGSWALGRGDSKIDVNGYRRTDTGHPAEPSCSDRYGGPSGISLGTALTISGAAVSPNWGYHSSPTVTFLLALFNIRLGWWLGNPCKDTYSDWCPRSLVSPIIAEALGLTDDQSKYIFLSDGGHFENMGLYEMVLRRCNIIVLCDAEQDGQYTYEGLGNAVRKIRIDLGIPIEFERQQLFRARSEDDSHPVANRCAIGRIRYNFVDGNVPDGVLVYVKPVCYGNEPRDVVAYSRGHHDFPHETTANQFFTESQFESYRALGLHTIGEIVGGSWLGQRTGSTEKDETSLEDMIDRIQIEQDPPNTLPPFPPAWVKCERIGRRVLKVSWEPRSRADKYVLFFQRIGVDAAFNRRDTTNAYDTIKHVRGAVAIRCYVQAINATGHSGTSNMIEFNLDSE
jgi:hypothetical protein